jgi:FMN phosphatase YigB (HAD superfamily)
MIIKNIIFDLGGVIIDIDYKRTIEAFRKLGAVDIDIVYSQSKQDSLFDEFETGKINSKHFREQLQNKLGIIVTDVEFDFAWNAMLLDLPLERLMFTKSLRGNYHVSLFSNTNDIHLREVFQICSRQNGVNNFGSFFDKEYYSHVFGKRKPNKDAFLAILEENGWQASETLFVDDSPQHILGAQEAGLQTIHITSGMSIFDVQTYLDQNNLNIRAQNYTMTMQH